MIILHASLFQTATAFIFSMAQFSISLTHIPPSPRSLTLSQYQTTSITLSLSDHLTHSHAHSLTLSCLHPLTPPLTLLPRLSLACTHSLTGSLFLSCWLTLVFLPHHQPPHFRMLSLSLTCPSLTPSLTLAHALSLYRPLSLAPALSITLLRHSPPCAPVWAPAGTWWARCRCSSSCSRRLAPSVLRSHSSRSECPGKLGGLKI